MSAPSKCPICGQSKLQQRASQVELLSSSTPVTFDVYECLSQSGQCAATRDDGTPGTRVLVPPYGFAAASRAGGTDVYQLEEPAAPAVAPAATGV
jgi:hypothetical protein